MSSEIERRTIVSDATVEYRDMGNGDKKPVISGYAAVFNTESRNLGGFVETIHPNAFDEVLSEGPDVIGVFNHDRNLLLGRTGNGTMKLTKDPYGLRYEITPNENTSIGRDVVEWVKDRTVVGSSFAFAIKRDGGDSWSTDPQRGIRRREVRAIGLLEDVGPVVRPAYDSSSVVVSRRAIEMALGESFRPVQTMANAAKRGLKLAQKAENVDSRLICIAERVANREIVSVEEVSYLSGVYERCLAAKVTGWSGTPSWIEWQLAGGDSGQKWVGRRSAAASEDSAEASATETRDAGEVNLKATAGMAAACKRGLRLYEAGRGGGGLVDETISWARKIAARENLTPEKVIKMRAWHARHSVDRRPGWDAPGRETPGFVAYLLWAGAAGKSFSERKAAELERSKEDRNAGDKSQSTPAPKEDQIKGSDKNPAGSAKNASGKITVNDSIREALKNKASNHNDEMRKADKPAWTRTTVGQLLAVYRRGAGAYSTSHRPGVSRGAWAMARVNAYLYLLRNGRPKDAKYISDDDLLPSGHPKASEKRDHMDGEMDGEMENIALSPANAELYDCIDEIAGEYGQWPQSGPDGAHYMEKSPFADRGLMCGNCCFYEQGQCEVVSGSIDPAGVCKLWIIPEDLMSEEKKPDSAPVNEEMPAEDTRAKQEQLDIDVKLAALKATILRTQLHGVNKG